MPVSPGGTNTYSGSNPVRSRRRQALGKLNLSRIFQATSQGRRTPLFSANPCRSLATYFRSLPYLYNIERRAVLGSQQWRRDRKGYRMDRNTLSNKVFDSLNLIANWGKLIKEDAPEKEQAEERYIELSRYYKGIGKAIIRFEFD